MIWSLLGNAIKNAATPVMDELSESKEGYLTLDASGRVVCTSVAMAI